MKKTVLAISVLFVFAAFFANAQKASRLDSATIANEKVEKVVPISEIPNVEGPRLFVVGDSTLSAFSDNYFYPRYGYGTRLSDYLDSSKITVFNLAMSGRSSKSFLTEKNYKTLTDNIREGDYLIIGFGHNDEKPGSRYADANGSKETEGSFKNILYENYVKLAKDRGAVPVLCTPVVRRSESSNYTGAAVHITADDEGFKGGNYPQAIIDLGAETSTLVVDLTKITKERYSKLSAKETAKFHAQKMKESDTIDNTHLNYYGAAVVAYDVVISLREQDKGFAAFVRDGISMPSEKILKKNRKYARPPK